MRIALDCDETLVETGPCLVDYYRSTIDADADLPWDIWSSRWEIWKGDKARWKEWFNGWIKSNWYTKMPPFPGALDAVKKLVDAGHTLFVVSAGLRSETARRRTHLENLFGPVFEDVICVDNSNEKSEVLQRLRIDAFVDDDINNLASAAPTPGIAIKMRANAHQAESLPANVRLADDWSHVLELLEGI